MGPWKWRVVSTITIYDELKLPIVIGRSLKWVVGVV